VKSFFLVDGNAYLHRAFHALPPLTTSKGEPVNAVFGFVRMLQKILKQYHPDHLIACFDTPAATFRHKLYKEYKATRKETDPSLRPQIPLAQELIKLWGIPLVSQEGYEADDLIATLADRAVHAGFQVTIVTGDKDALQLVSETVSVLNESKSLLMTPEAVVEKYGLKPCQLVDYFSLMGDASDNVPGVTGIGEKTATQLLQKYGDLETILSFPVEMKQPLRQKLESQRDQALLSKTLVTLDRQVPIPLDIHSCVVQKPDMEHLLPLVNRLEFTHFLSDISAEPAPSLKTRQVNVVLTAEQLAELVRLLRGASRVAVDVETTGVQPLSCRLVGISLSTEPDSAWYIPIAHDYEGAPRQLPLPDIIQALRPSLGDPRVPKYGQNLKFDYLVLKKHGLTMDGIGFDTLIASYCLNPSRNTHNLKALALDYLGETMTTIEELIGKGAKQTTMNTIPIDKVADYAGADAAVALSLADKMAPELKEKNLEALWRDVEMPLVEVLASMEENGIRVDPDYLSGLRKEFERMISDIASVIERWAGEPFNLNSPKQLAHILFEKLKLPPGRKTKTGYSTDEGVLRQLTRHHELPAKLIEHRELSKLKSTFIDGLIEQINPETGRVHTHLNQAVTATGRLSSSDPNLQNIPVRTEYGRMIRKAFVAAPGHRLLSADYSQIDLRVLAHISGDEVLCRTFRQGGDIHTATAADIFGIASDQVSPEQRRIAKTVNFGIVYGQTAFGLAQQLEIDVREAQRYINSYFERYAGVKRWIDSCVEQARKQGAVTTLLNRIRYLPEINSPNISVRQFAERTAMNTPVQGTSADIIKLAMREIFQALRRTGLRTKMLLQVHDDLLFEAPESELGALQSLVIDKMENALSLNVPLRVDLKCGSDWADMKSLPHPQ